MESKIIHKKIEGNYSIAGNEDVILHGMITGNAEICENAMITIHGMVIGNLIIEKNSNVVIHGTVCGNVINNGGNLTHFGMIHGKFESNSGNTILKKYSVVGKRKLTKEEIL